MRRKLATTVVVASAMALAACQSKAPDTLPPQPAGSTPPPDSAGPIPGSQADFLAQMSGRQVIYFDTDRYNIDSADIAALQAQAQWMQQYPNKRATIEGHSDERGTRDYNLALGERRANAAKNYLVSLGVDASRLSTVSYGKERPEALGSDESAWSRNRRAVTITID
ncbi:putative peptidoglycan-associated lipoprotein [Caenibius tardaugens NBRC 16725]|uniref:Peptidoglycan-associated lipoprotein n=1 Tax=Caenibius tardaugens NBRC 16725 TaxID=1219035 RepID=U2YB37_9SPHN|nr:peptidoglycan-associated lipoprotein Pal [Caenibius tardaugens]AZI35776.1 peptidoglycan-associated lipoprotein Pal [Caenibius tardaugens NBRC 16725]GAD50666.1 putative peptidoglycan-associated lipoprotein [Caenibius tardaugens NBRC 16725]